MNAAPALRRLALAAVRRAAPALALAALLAAPALAQDRRETLEESFRHCVSATGEPIVLVASCTAAINSGQLQPDALALALTVRASAFGDSERPDLGLADADRALSIDDGLSVARRVRADLHAQLRDYGKSLEDLDAILAKTPDDVVTLRRRGAIHDFRGEHEAAIADFDAALRVKQESDTYIDRAIARVGAGDAQRAADDLEAALRLAPDDPGALFERGQLRFRTGDFGGAAADFAKAADAKKEDAYYAIWAYLGGARSGAADAAPALARRAGGLDLAEWPGQVIELYLGRRQPEGVSPPTTSRIAWKPEGWRCEADFYLGEYYLLRGDAAAARPRIEAAAASPITEFIEHRAATDELKRLPP